MKDTNGAAIFLDWCNHPIFQVKNELGFRTRVQPQFPEYNTYGIIDENGRSILSIGVFLTSTELYEFYLYNIYLSANSKTNDQKET